MVGKLKQPKPQPNNHPAIWDLVIEDIKERDKFGLKKYGTRLQPFNGRDTLQDMIEEILDFIVYSYTARYEWEKIKELLKNISTILIKSQNLTREQIVELANLISILSEKKRVNYVEERLHQILGYKKDVTGADTTV